MFSQEWIGGSCVFCDSNQLCSPLSDMSLKRSLINMVLFVSVVQVILVLVLWQLL